MEQKMINPFPGLRPFQKDESHLFFGRENHIQEIQRKLNVFRFVSIVGNSGSGKSSLVRAGLLPILEKNTEEPWKICTMRPGKYPIEELAEAIDNQLSDNFQTVSVEQDIEILNKSKLGLVQILRSKIQRNEKILILVDQFEELFRFSGLQDDQTEINHASHFVDLLLSAISQKEVPIYVIMTIRSDFLGDCEQFLGLPEAINDGQFLIPRMNREELQRSITGPIDLVHGKISPQLVHELLNKVGNSPDQLPVLQHVLMRTWEVWEAENQTAKPIDIDTYNKTGGMAKALSNHAEEAYAELNTERKRKIAEHIFKTITLKGQDNRGIRRPTVLSTVIGITESSLKEVVEVIDVFRRTDRGFLMPPANIELTDKSILDISHESLMRVWERLNHWVNEEADSAEIFQRVCESAILYDKNMAGLWRDPDLQIAIDWRNNNSPNIFWANQYNSHYEIAMRFIDLSIQDKQFLVAERNRRKKLTRITVIIFLVILSGLTVWAYIERFKSSKNEKLALSEKERALKQEQIASEQRKSAEENAAQAKIERNNAESERSNAERQKLIAEQSAQEAKLERLKAERASISANDARKAAELDKQIAQYQKLVSDSMKYQANQAEKKAYSLRMLSIAQTLAIKSAQADRVTYEDDALKPLLAMQSYNFNESYNGKKFDPDIYVALFSAERSLQNKNEYVHNFHNDAVRSVSYSPDGKTIASAGNDGKLILCQSGNVNTMISNFPQQNLLIDNIHFNQAGTKICASTDDKNILIYDIKNPSLKPKLINPLITDKISALVWNQNQIIAASFDMSLKLIDEQTGNTLKSIQLPTKPLTIALHDASHQLLIGCENGMIYKVDVNEFKEAKLLKQGSKAKITAIDFSTNGKKVACGTSEGIYIVFDISNPDKNEYLIAAHKSSITCIQFNPISNFIATSSLDGTIKLWNLNQADEQPIIYNEHDSWVWNIAFSPNGKMLASGGKDKTLRTYIVSEEELFRELQSKVKRNMTIPEWTKYVGSDIPYEKTINK